MRALETAATGGAQTAALADPTRGNDGYRKLSAPADPYANQRAEPESADAEQGELIADAPRRTTSMDPEQGA